MSAVVLIDDSTKVVQFFAVADESQVTMAAKPCGPCVDLVDQIRQRRPPYGGLSYPEVLSAIERQRWRSVRVVRVQEVTDEAVKVLDDLVKLWDTPLVQLIPRNS